MRPLVGLTPARAGSTARNARSCGTIWTHPRSRGEHPTASGWRDSNPDSPPLARGARIRLHKHLDGTGLTPARAGSTPAANSRWSRRRTHPRSRGEHCEERSLLRHDLDSPPLARGAPYCERVAGLEPGLTPARAGSTRWVWPSATQRRTHPRSRGEHRRGRSGRTPCRDSPPLARGARATPPVAAGGGGLTPARAGSTNLAPSQSPWRGTHPRSRGEHELGRHRVALQQDSPRSRGEHEATPVTTSTMEDSPPLARGAPHRQTSHDRFMGLTPARAGSTGHHPSTARTKGTHPRSRGEHPPAPAWPNLPRDSPPLARGARDVHRRSLAVAGLTPARAGSTSPGYVSVTMHRTHPRSRGEHPPMLYARRSGTDSPPLARGAPSPVDTSCLRPGLTPARAGSTATLGPGTPGTRTHPRSRGEC